MTEHNDPPDQLNGIDPLDSDVDVSRIFTGEEESSTTGLQITEAREIDTAMREIVNAATTNAEELLRMAVSNEAGVRIVQLACPNRSDPSLIDTQYRLGATELEDGVKFYDYTFGLVLSGGMFMGIAWRAGSNEMHNYAYATAASRTGNPPITSMATLQEAQRQLGLLERAKLFDPSTGVIIDRNAASNSAAKTIRGIIKFLRIGK